MAYIDGFVIAVPKANKQKFIDHADMFDNLILEFGATRILECWERRRSRRQADRLPPRRAGDRG